MRPLNLFYEELDPDRWFRWDRFPRGLVRRIVRGRRRPGGHERMFLNLCAGLDLLGAPYRVNDYRHIRDRPDELACVIGKPHVLQKIPRGTPILFGAAIYAHPIDNPDLALHNNVRTVLVPSAWMRTMFTGYWPVEVKIWPAGIDTELWAPATNVDKDIDLLIYDKIYWRREEREASFLPSVFAAVLGLGLRVRTIRYGFYEEEEFLSLVKRSRAAIFLSEHETQGFALLQTLAAGVPVLAWDSGSDWQHPTYYPDRIKFGPVTSVPYWDDRCGHKFRDAGELPGALQRFWDGVLRGQFLPRSYVLEHLTLERCARHYLDIASAIAMTAGDPGEA
jgi:hypothetical protein